MEQNLSSTLLTRSKSAHNWIWKLSESISGLTIGIALLKCYIQIGCEIEPGTVTFVKGPASECTEWFLLVEYESLPVGISFSDYPLSGHSGRRMKVESRHHDHHHVDKNTVYNFVTRNWMVWPCVFHRRFTVASSSWIREKLSCCKNVWVDEICCLADSGVMALWSDLESVDIALGLRIIRIMWDR